MTAARQQNSTQSQPGQMCVTIHRKPFSAQSAVASADPRYSSCVTKQLFTFALGRGSEVRDREYLDYMTSEWSAGGQRLRDLIKLVVTSDPFRLRRGEVSTARIAGSEP